MYNNIFQNNNFPLVIKIISDYKCIVDVKNSVWFLIHNRTKPTKFIRWNAHRNPKITTQKKDLRFITTRPKVPVGMLPSLQIISCKMSFRWKNEKNHHYNKWTKF